MDVEWKVGISWYVQLSVSRGQRFEAERAIELSVATSHKKDAQPDGWPLQLTRGSAQEICQPRASQVLSSGFWWRGVLARLENCVWVCVCECLCLGGSVTEAAVAWFLLYWLSKGRKVESELQYIISLQNNCLRFPSVEVLSLADASRSPPMP